MVVQGSFGRVGSRLRNNVLSRSNRTFSVHERNEMGRGYTA